MSDHMICIEWGTARLRARVIDGQGRTVETHAEAVRLADLDRSGIAERIDGLRRRWRDVPGPMILSGMIGSGMGWQDIARVNCPASAKTIADGAVMADIGSQAVVFLPGLACVSRFGDPDVLRGEEVAAIGALAQPRGLPGLLLSVPGMHGKWMTHNGAAITQFHTSMTVELYRVLAERSVLAPLMAAHPVEGVAFRTGVARGAEGGGLARLLFAARSAVQAGALDTGGTASLLWGLLIGADVRENLPLAPDAICLVAGDAAVAPLFAAAIRQLGGAAEVGDADQLTATGFRHLAMLLRTKGILA